LVVRTLIGCSIAALLGLLPATASRAQTTQFLPEVNTYVKLNSELRFAFQAKQTRENGEPTEGEVGPSMQFYWKPLKPLLQHHVDEARKRFILVSAGYRYLPSLYAPVVNRVLTEATPRVPLGSKLVLLDRNRGELNFSSNQHTWRYRNRLRLEREFAIHSYHPTPYASAEFFYDTKYAKWSSTTIDAGCQFPIRKHSEIDAYYEHQNNTGKRPNQRIDALGLGLNLYF